MARARGAVSRKWDIAFSWLRSGAFARSDDAASLRATTPDTRPRIAVNADQRPDDLRLSDIEHRFTCAACGKSDFLLHHIRAGDQSGRYFEPKLFRGLQVDHEFEAVS